MADFDRIEVSATLNIPDATKQIQMDLETISKNLNPINVNAKINSDVIKQQTQQIQSQINNVVGQTKTIPINIDTNNIDNFVQQLKSLNSNDEGINNLISQIDNLNIQITKASASYKILDDNTKSLSSVRVSGIDDLGQTINYVSKFNTQTGELVNSTTKFNDTIAKINSTSQSTFDNMDIKAQRLSQTINEIQAKFSTIDIGSSSGWSSQVQSVNANVQQLRDNFNAFNNAPIGQDKVQAFNTLKNSVQDTKKQVNDLFKAQQSLANVDITSNKFESYLRENSQVADKFPTKVNAIRSSLKSLRNETDTAKLTSGLQNVNKQFDNLKTSAEEAGIEGRTALQEISNDLKKMFYWTIGGTFIFGTFREIKQGIQDITDLDSALTTMNMTMNTTKSQLQDLGNSIVNMANKLGTSVSNVSQVAEIYANMNESASSVMDKIKSTTLLSTASGMSGSEAATTLQAIKNQFDLTDDSAQHLTDTLEKLSANLKLNFTTGIQNISDAVKNSGSVAKEAGESFEQYAAQVSEVAEATGLEGNTIGAAFRTIFSRITRANSGEATKEEISKADKAFQSIGVNVRKSNGQFKDLSVTLNELYQKWGNLTSVEKSYIAEQAAGVRRKSIFLALMNNYSKVLDLTTKAENSNGFAMETNEKRMNSIQAKTEQFTASVTQLWTTLINSDAIKTVVDSGTGLVNVFTNLNKTIGGLPTVIGLATAALSGFKNVGKQYAYVA